MPPGFVDSTDATTYYAESRADAATYYADSRANAGIMAELSPRNGT